MPTNLDCTVLVASCDKYADLLRPFDILWRKYWADCPFETVLVTETTPAGGGMLTASLLAASAAIGASA